MTRLTFSLCHLASQSRPGPENLNNMNQLLGKKQSSKQFQFRGCSLAFVLPFSLHERKINPCQWWLGNCEFPTYEEAQKGHGILGRGGNPLFQGDSSGRHQKRRDAVERASLPSTSLALNASVQLCTDFFLRTSCGSHNNDSRALPPLSPLKYGNCIIQVQGPLFSHSWAITGTINP